MCDMPNDGIAPRGQFYLDSVTEKKCFKMFQLIFSDKTCEVL